MSTFLVHLTRNQEDRDAKECLIQIISDWQLNAGNTQGPATRRLRTAGMEPESEIEEFADLSKQKIVFIDPDWGRQKLTEYLDVKAPWLTEHLRPSRKGTTMAITWCVDVPVRPMHD